MVEVEVGFRVAKECYVSEGLVRVSNCSERSRRSMHFVIIIRRHEDVPVWEGGEG